MWDTYDNSGNQLIMSDDTGEAVQLELELERREKFAEKNNIGKLDYASADNPFAGRVICGCCGSTFGRKVWNSTDERLRRIIWRCNAKYEIKGKIGCENRHIDDSILYKAFVSAFNAMVENRKYFLEKWNNALEGGNVLVKFKTKQFINIISKAAYIEEFDIDIYFKIIEKMIVLEGNKIIVTLLDGTEIECKTG